MKRLGAVVAQGGVFLIFGLFGQSARDVRQWDLPVTVEGSVVVHFTGGGRTGTIVWTPARQGQLTVSTARTAAGRRVAAVFAISSEGGPQIAARVERDGGGLCTDVDQQIFGFASTRQGRDSVRIGLAGTGPRDQGFALTETLCGGPLSEDLAHALPTVMVGRRQLTKGGFKIDMRRTAAFAGGGVRGTVESTIVMTVGRRKPVRKPRIPDELKPRPLREMLVEYRVERVTGVVRGAFIGGGPLCAELDSCGAEAVWTMQPGRARGTAFVEVVAPARRPVRDLRAAAGLSTRGNPRGIELYGAASWSSRSATATGAFSRAGVQECSDTRHVGASGLALELHGRTMRVLFAPAEDRVRTSCPGPGLFDESAGAEEALAAGTVPLRAFRHKRVVIHVRRGRPHSTDGWSGRTTTNLTVTLRRVRTRVKVVKFF